MTSYIIHILFSFTMILTCISSFFIYTTPSPPMISSFFFNDPAPTEISPLSLHAPLPIPRGAAQRRCHVVHRRGRVPRHPAGLPGRGRPAAPRGHHGTGSRLRAGNEGRQAGPDQEGQDRKSTRLNSSHDQISYAVFCFKKK